MLKSSKWLGPVLMVLACGVPVSDAKSGADEQGEQSASEALRKKPADAGVCLGQHETCESAHTVCCPGTRCMEYTVYDYRRCLVPSAAGQYCYRDEQCASGKCIAGRSTCAP